MLCHPVKVKQRQISHLLKKCLGQAFSGAAILIMLWPGCIPFASQSPHRSKSGQTQHYTI